MKVAIVYWSGTGNTEEMAKAVLDGVVKNNNEGTLFTSDKFTSDLINDFDAFAFGCPSMGAEELEDEEFLPMWNKVKSSLVGKNIVLFGSYGWGDGEWMESWKEDCDSINVLGSFICNDSPDNDAVIKCNELGTLL